MLTEHLERLAPVCPLCRLAERPPARLELGPVARADGEDVVEGALVCTSPQCRREHPIVDGIPVVVADLAGWAAHQLPAVLRREDLTPFTLGLLGDAAGPASELDRERSNLSGYGHDHWLEESFADLVAAALAQGPPPAGVWLDAGCAVGRGTVELARAGAELAVGVDLSFAMVRAAERVRRTGRAEMAVRRSGIVYDRVDRDVGPVPASAVSFWCADATLLPFGEGAFAGALSLNVLDCVPAPAAHLAELARTLAPGGTAHLSTPFDWAPTTAAVDQWIGGHSQRAPHGGDPAAELRRLLGARGGLGLGLEIVAERDRVPWRVYANERSHVEYELLLLALRRSAGGGELVDAEG